MSEFVNYLAEVFEPFGETRSRKMFGGHGLYHDDLMFGLIADDTLYLKADDQSKQTFLDQGLTPFMYNKNGRQLPMSYYQAPESIFDDPDEAVRWARLAFDAALRNRKPKRKRSKKKPASKG